MIGSAKYARDGSINIVFDGKEMTVPDDMANRHRIILAEWETEGNVIEPYIPESTPEQLIIIPSVTFWERTTEAEGLAIEAMLNQQSFRIRQIFMTAQSYRSDHELWPLLQSAANQLFGAQRALQLLAQP